MKNSSCTLSDCGASTDDNSLCHLKSAPLQKHALCQRLPLTVAEGVAVEDHEVTDRAQGAQVFRAAQFWGRSVTIYLSYKKMQARQAHKARKILISVYIVYCENICALCDRGVAKLTGLGHAVTNKPCQMSFPELLMFG